MPGPSHCALVCTGNVLRAVGSMLLTLVLSDGRSDGRGRGRGRSDGRSSDDGGKGAGSGSKDSTVLPALPASVYVVDECEPEYARVPCPLYPLPDSVKRALRGSAGLRPEQASSSAAGNLPATARARGAEGGADGSGASVWEQPLSAEPRTRAWQLGRLATSIAWVLDEDVPQVR